jgi:hypothetical protein
MFRTDEKYSPPVSLLWLLVVSDISLKMFEYFVNYIEVEIFSTPSVHVLLRISKFQTKKKVNNLVHSVTCLYLRYFVYFLFVYFCSTISKTKFYKKKIFWTVNFMMILSVFRLKYEKVSVWNAVKHWNVKPRFFVITCKTRDIFCLILMFDRPCEICQSINLMT